MGTWGHSDSSQKIEAVLNLEKIPINTASFKLIYYKQI